MSAPEGAIIMTATSRSDGKWLSSDNDVPTPRYNRTRVDEAALIRKIVSGQQDLFGVLRARYYDVLTVLRGAWRVRPSLRTVTHRHRRARQRVVRFLERSKSLLPRSNAHDHRL